MIILRLRGRITESGKLEVKLPPGLPACEVNVTITYIDESASKRANSLTNINEDNLHHETDTDPSIGNENQ